MQKILTVDDSLVIRNIISTILKSSGFDVDTAINGIDGLEKIYTNSYDLVISDINMPKMDGLKMVQTLRENDEYKDLKIIVLSTEEEEEDKKRGLEAGANIYLVKPVKPKDLVTNVRMLLE
ncbi:MAG: response regulator [Candidatus Anammoxibacter sp.]